MAKHEKSLTQVIEELMVDGNEWSPYHIQSELRKRGRIHSDATISRRMRDLRGKNYDLTWRYIKGTRTTLYQIKNLKNICTETHKALENTISPGL